MTCSHVRSATEFDNFRSNQLLFLKILVQLHPPKSLSIKSVPKFQVLGYFSQSLLLVSESWECISLKDIHRWCWFISYTVQLRNVSFRIQKFFAIHGKSLFWWETHIQSKQNRSEINHSLTLFEAISLKT